MASVFDFLPAPVSVGDVLIEAYPGNNGAVHVVAWASDSKDAGVGYDCADMTRALAQIEALAARHGGKI